MEQGLILAKNNSQLLVLLTWTMVALFIVWTGARGVGEMWELYVIHVTNELVAWIHSTRVLGEHAK